MTVAGYYGITLAVRVSVCRTSVFSFPDDTLSKCQWIFTKLGWFGIVNGQISSIFDMPATGQYFHFITSVNINAFSPNLARTLILWRSALGLLMDEFRQFLTELYARDTFAFSFLDDNFSK